MGDWLVEVREIELEYSFAENGQKSDRCIWFYNKFPTDIVLQ